MAILIGPGALSFEIAVKFCRASRTAAVCFWKAASAGALLPEVVLEDEDIEGSKTFSESKTKVTRGI